MICKIKAFAHHEVHVKGEYVLSQTHKYHEIVYYKNGSGHTTIDGAVYAFHGGCVAVIPAQVVHDEEHTENGEVYFCLFECNEDISRMFQEKVVFCSKELLALVEDSFHQIESEYGGNLLYEEPMLNHHLTLMLIRLAGSASRTKYSDETIAYVRAYICSYYRSRIRWDILAQTVGYSESRMRHLFTEKYGQSPHQFLLLTRIAVAKGMIEEDMKSLEEIARECGFSTPSKFSEYFRQNVGVTPNQYRRAARQPDRNRGERLI